MNKGTVLYVGGFELPDKNAAAHRVMNNALLINELGYDVVFCGNDKMINSFSLDSHIVKGFKSMPLPYPKGKAAWIKRLLSIKEYKNICKCNKEIKMIIAYNLHALPLLRMELFCKKNDIKLISDLTEWDLPTLSTNPLTIIKWIDCQLSMRCFQKHVDGMIVISNYLRNYYSKYIQNIIVVPPLVDIEDEIWNQQPNSCRGIARFVYSGSISLDSNCANDKDKLGEIVKVLSNVNEDYIFEIIGISKEEFLLAYPNLKEELLKTEEKIRFRGKVSHKESVLYLINSDCCIFIRNPSRKNNAGFPTKFVECYTIGIDIIANDISDISEYFPNYGNSMLISNDNIEEGLRKAIMDYLSLNNNYIGKERLKKHVKDTFYYRNWIGIFRDFFNKF